MLKNARNIRISPKWYFSTVIIFITVLGIIGGRLQNTMPNQEIVLQFTNQDVSLTEAKHTIAIVEQQLQRIGVGDIHVSEQEDGKLVITYYSNTTVEVIKKLLSSQKELALGFVASDKGNKPPSLPSENDGIGYDLNVYEIHDGQNSVSDLGGKCAVELKTGQLRFLNPHFYIPSDDFATQNIDHTLKVAYTFQRYSAIVKNNRSHKIPEVRAGPLS